jgi:hypothetical protein
VLVRVRVCACVVAKVYIGVRACVRINTTNIASAQKVDERKASVMSAEQTPEQASSHLNPSQHSSLITPGLSLPVDSMGEDLG